MKVSPRTSKIEPKNPYLPHFIIIVIYWIIILAIIFFIYFELFVQVYIQNIHQNMCNLAVYLRVWFLIPMIIPLGVLYNIVKKGQSIKFSPLFPFIKCWSILSGGLYLVFLALYINFPPNGCDTHELLGFFWFFNNFAFTAFIFWITLSWKKRKLENQELEKKEA